jgi:hypothetical protein
MELSGAEHKSVKIIETRCVSLFLHVATPDGEDTKRLALQIAPMVPFSAIVLGRLTVKS